jgi:hypothetical protein
VTAEGLEIYAPMRFYADGDAALTKDAVDGRRRPQDGMASGQAASAYP